MKKWLFAVPVVVLAGVIASGFLFAPNDQVQITKALNDSCAAAGRGEPSDVFKYLSRNFKYGGEETNTFDISKVIHQAKPKIVILDTKAQIEGETATVQTPVDVQLDFAGLNINKTIPGVTITLKKETGFKWLVVPEPRWRITAVDAKNLPTD
jgi:hypothetical protein